MIPPPDGLGRIVATARRLADQREYGPVAELLAPLDEADLLHQPVLAFLLAEAWHRRGEVNSALRLVQLAVPVCLRRGNDSVYRECLNLEGVLLFGRGEIEAAEEAWNRLLAAATHAADEELLSRVNNNFGVLYTLRGDQERALFSYARATAACQRLSYLRGLAQVHNNLGITYREMDFFDEADHHFQEALGYASADGSADEAGRATIERAVLLSYRRDLGLARATADRAVTIWKDLADPVGEGECRRVLGLVSAAAGEWDAAEEEANRALAIAVASSASLLEAEVLELLSMIQERNGGAAAARENRARAEALFAAMGAAGWGRQLRRRLQQVIA